MNASKNLIYQLDRMCLDGHDPETVHQAVTCLMDHVGTYECGRALFNDHREKYLSYFNNEISVKDEAFLRGYFSHILELDDGHRRSMSHPGSVVLSALLCVAAKKDIPGDRLIDGIICGYEAAIRCGIAVQPGHKKKGFHTSATSGTIGAAMAVAYACGFDENEKLAALAAAVTCASGTLALQDDDSEMKPVNIAQAAMNGVLAAQTGAMDLRPPEDPIAGDRGLLSLYTDTPDLSLFEEGYEGRPLIETIYRKKHASCRHAHGPVDCALLITRTNDIDVSKIASVTVGTYDLAIKGHDEVTYDNPNAARLSIPYSIASAIIRGHVETDDFTQEAIEEPAVSSLAKKVKVLEDDEFTRALPNMRGARVSIEMDDGSVYNERVERPLGEPENPLGLKEITEKTIALLGRAGYDAEETEDIIKSILSAGLDPTELYKKEITK